jgi:hypothetical protein
VKEHGNRIPNEQRILGGRLPLPGICTPEDSPNICIQTTVSVKTYLVRFRSPGMIAQLVIAASAEIEGDQIVMRDSQGEMVASFSMDLVESWTASDRHDGPERP